MSKNSAPMTSERFTHMQHALTVEIMRSRERIAKEQAIIAGFELQLNEAAFQLFQATNAAAATPAPVIADGVAFRRVSPAPDAAPEA